jgi:hypothetical protein
MNQIGISGTPFMWATHENTVLRTILNQLEIFGYTNAALNDWLLGITSDKGLERKGRLVDMNDLTKKYYFHPFMKGRTSIKKVLPAIWNNNLFLHEVPLFKKYLIRDSENNILDPYDTLYNLANDKLKEITEDLDIQSEDVKGGTAAMRAFHRIRFDDSISLDYKEELKCRLLEYCKLDTMAMVIIWFYWKNIKTFKSSNIISDN